MNWLASGLHVTIVAQMSRTERFSDDPATYSSIKAKGKQDLPKALAYIESVMCDGRLCGFIAKDAADSFGSKAAFVAAG